MLKFPYEIIPIENNLNKEISQHVRGEPFVKVGKEEYFFPSKYLLEAEKIYNFNIRSDDVWIITFPRSGTTLTQDLVWLISNNFNYEKAKSIPLSVRSPFLEFNVFIDDKFIKEYKTEHTDSIDNLNVLEIITTQSETLSSYKGRRFIKTHLPFSLLPPNLLTSGAKVVYVARNPKDVAVSYFHLHKLFKTLDFKGNFETFWDYFQKGLVGWGPYWSHVKEGWENRDQPNVLFLMYEEMNKNLPKCIEKAAIFLDCSITKNQIDELSDYLNIKNFRSNPSVNFDKLKEVGICQTEAGTFIRAGKTGGWKNYFSFELNKKADNWIEENLKTISLRFPQSEQ